MSFLQPWYEDILFRLSVRTWIEWLDLLLVVITFFLLLNWARRRQAAFLLRGALVLAVVLFIVTIVLPLPTFDWLIRGFLIAIVIAAPVIFHPELRRLLERLGRSVGVAWADRRGVAESVVSELVKAIEVLADEKTGALIVLEGNAPLIDLTETGVLIGGRVSDDFIRSIFYGENPLHDGALIIRENKVIAAGCVLPLTSRSLVYSGRRLGTRHRAAVGLSESSDALIIVVSEETGEISVAREGRLHRPLTINDLREQLFDFHLPNRPSKNNGFLKDWPTKTLFYIKRGPRLPRPSQILGQLGLLFVAILFAVTLWSFVIEQTNPARRVLVDNITLRVEDIPTGTILVEPPPNTVSALVQTTDNAFPTVRPSSFQATVSLANQPPGLHHLNVQVIPSIAEVQVLSVEPAAVDLELAEVISRTLPVSIDLSNQQNMSPAYQIVRVPMATPAEVQVSGPAPLVEQVSQVRTRLSLTNVTASINELRPVEAIDEAGRTITGVTLQPSQVQLSVTIQRRLNAIDVGVRAVTENSPPAGYWLSDLRVTPASVTLQGDPGQLTEMGSFVDTLPVDISEATGDLTIEIPLNLPSGIQAIDSNGNSVRNVIVTARITARTGDLALTKSVELLNAPRGTRVTVDPTQVDLLLSGPLPKLNEIAENPNLVRVLVDTVRLQRGQNIEVTPRIVAPADIEVQAIPPTVLVSFPES